MVGFFFKLFFAFLPAGLLASTNSPVVDCTFVAFDTETTGVVCADDRIVEIGAVKFRGDGKVICATNWLVNPQREIPFFVTRVHGIDNRMVADAPAFPVVWEHFRAFCGDGVLMAHNARFDVDFLRAELERAGIQIPAMPVIDSLPLFRKWFPGEASYSLEKLTASRGVAGATYHRAKADAFHIVHLFRAGQLNRPGITLKRLERDAGGFRRLDGKNKP